MKISTALILLFIPTLVFSQNAGSNKISVDTVKYTYVIPEVISATSFVPQLKANRNMSALNKINNDIKKYFVATSMILDSASFIQSLFEMNDVKTIEEYKQLLKDNPEIGKDDESEHFTIEYMSENLLNISVSRDLIPYKGQLMHYYNSLCYDLKTGNKLAFKDFFNITNETLAELIKNDGYSIDEDYELDDSLRFRKIERPNDQINIVINYVLPNITAPEVLCTDFYFNKEDHGVHLRFRYACSGPSPELYGIPIKKLSKYVVYPEFGNSAIKGKGRRGFGIGIGF